MVTKSNVGSVEDTVARFLDLLAVKGVRLFVVIDQRKKARQVGLDLRETVLVVFGDRRAGPRRWRRQSYRNPISRIVSTWPLSKASTAEPCNFMSCIMPKRQMSTA